MKVSITGSTLFGKETFNADNLSTLADLGICRNPRYKLGAPVLREYLKLVPISEPVADFEGRNAVYAMKYYCLLSVMYFKDSRFRDIFASELKALVDKVEAEGNAATAPSRL